MPKNKASKALINSMKMPERDAISGLFHRKVINGADNDSYYAENPTSASFSVVVDGKSEFDSTRWTEVSGLSFTVSVVEHQEGGENGFDEDSESELSLYLAVSFKASAIVDFNTLSSTARTSDLNTSEVGGCLYC